VTSKRVLADSTDRQKAIADTSMNYIVEAAAGTGKTTLLVDRMLGLVTEKKASPDDIVAITFTERAAAELKARFQRRLADHLAKASGADEAYVEAALRGLERMQITTIHSFCTTLLKERPVEAGVDPNFEVADELRSSLIARGVWDEWLGRHMDGDDPVLRQAVLLGVTLDHMHALGEAMRADRDVLDCLPEAMDIDSDLKVFTGELHKGIRELSAISEEGCSNHSDRAWQTISNISQCHRELPGIKNKQNLEAFILNRLTFPSPGRLGNKANWSPCEVLDTVRERLEHLREVHSKLTHKISHNALASLAGRLLDYVRAYDQAKREQGLLDFQDLLIHAHAMLKDHPDATHYFRRRYRYLLVDEFQDTDPLQAEIIFLLSGRQGDTVRNWDAVRPEPGRVFLVGDPKQSIYRFRRADIEMYAAARSKLGKRHTLTIHENFRCVPSIVAAVNSVFEDLIKSPDDGDYQPDYVPLHFGRDTSTLPPKHGVILLHPPPEMKDSMVSVDRRRTYESRCIAAFIKELVEKHRWKIWDKESRCLRQVMLKDVAVLMRTNTGLGYLEDALRLYGVSYRVLGGKHFYVRQEVQQLLAVLRAIDNPYDKIAIVAALRSPFFGISDEDLFLYHARGGRFDYLKAGDTANTLDMLKRSLCSSSDLESIGADRKIDYMFGLLKHFHSIRNDISLDALLRRLYEETKTSLIYLLKPNGEQRVANVLKVADTARALHERGICTLRGVVKWLSEREAEKAEESEAMTVEPGDDFVRLLTVHKAKGLEFPVVILSDLAATRTASERFIVDRRNRDIAVRIGSKESGLCTQNYMALEEYERRRSEAEERRLLYVAMTRARDLLIVPAYWASKRELDREGRPKAGSLLSYLTDKTPGPEAIAHGKHADSMMIYDVSDLDLEPEEPPPFRVPVAPPKPEPEIPESIRAELDYPCRRRSQISAWAEGARPLLVVTEDLVSGTTVYRAEGASRGTEFGRLVHRLLEVIDWQEPGQLEAIAYGEAHATGVPENMVGAATAMVRKTLASDLAKRVIHSECYFREVPFAFKQNGNIVEGRIDVVFREDDDITVIDFKTDRVTRGSIKSKVEDYRPQTETYARAVQAGFGRLPREVILYFLHLMEPVVVFEATRSDR
jgi:ATP-dependent helicase/nuclease subunit A